MTSFSSVYAQLRRKNRNQYALLAGCCFFSVLLITAYVCMISSPTVLEVLPEGGDSRKQMMMIFALTVIGCGVFTTYASGLFFRYKSRETGVFLALGASRSQLKQELTKELSLLSLCSCALGAILGTPLAWGIWSLFRFFLVDTQEMTMSFNGSAYLFALAFSLFVILTLFVSLTRFIRRTNIIDVVNESRKSEPIRNVPNYYGILGIALMVLGAFLGYMAPTFCVRVLHWYAPEGLTSIFYVPLFIGLYMMLLHTVVNGWRKGKSRYKNLVGISMMKFQGRQTVRNMLIITVLVAGAYFGSFYTPMLGTASMMSFDARPVDYSFHYRADQTMPSKEEIEQKASDMDVVMQNYRSESYSILAYDGIQQIETSGSFGTTYTKEYREVLSSSRFFSESAYNALTGESLKLAPGTVATVLDTETGTGGGRVNPDISLVTNTITGESLQVTPVSGNPLSDMLFTCRVLDDADYARLTAGLPNDFRGYHVFFDVENVEDTYFFAKSLFNELVDRSGPEVEVYSGWDPVERQLDLDKGEPYYFDQEENKPSYDLCDSSEFRLYWDYMPMFRVMDQADFVKTTAVFLMLFVFIAIVCFSAVIVITYTRSLTLALTNKQVFHDLRHLGAPNDYLYRNVKNQLRKVFFTPIFIGTVLMFLFYGMIMSLNSGGFELSSSELAGMGACLLLVAALSAFFFGIYRLTLRKVCHILDVRQQRIKS